MKKIALGVAALNLVACGGAQMDSLEEGLANPNFDATTLAASAHADDKIPGHYIVVLREGVNPADFAYGHGISPNFIYRTALNGFAGPIGPGVLSRIEQDSRVAYVEQDGVARTSAQTIPYGISNVAATTAPSVLAGNGSGALAGPTVFVIDTGIATHADLNIVGHVNYASGQNTDCNGHGTHVAGTVGAKDDTNYVVGVAPGVRLFGVKVLDCAGSGTYSGVINGMNYVASSTIGQKVANMSLGGGFSQAVNDAARNMVNNNVAVAVAAGNDGADASTKSPASEPSVLTVAAHDSNNVNASWSNFGSVVDLSAPGVNTLSTSKSGGTTTMSGTSMASPHVAGALAIYRAKNPTASGAQAISGVKANTSGTSSRGFGRLYVGNW
ncbi:MAG TPA: S8 family serine peptidase [Myxococcaceae bacterium]|nr:S8 family serine peptidase [Myxococcaceae bacterium]